MADADPTPNEWEIGLGEALTIAVGALHPMPAVNLP